MKIVISNAYCYLNKGDAGIIRAMVQELKQMFPDAEIKVVSLYEELDINKYGDSQVIGSIVNIYDGKSKYFKIIKNTMLYFWISILNKLKIPYNDTVRDFKEADIIVSCGGGYFKARSLTQFFGDFMYHYIQFKTALDFNKPLVIYAQTVGEFSDNYIVMKKVKKILNKASLVLAREPISYEYVSKILLDRDNYFATSDIAFLLRKKEINLIEESESFKIGVTLRNWHFPGRNNRDSLLKEYKSAVNNVLRDLLQRENIEVFIMPQVIGPNDDNDLIISREIYNNLKNYKNLHLLESDILPEELKYIYSQMDLFIGTRMHSNIFALAEQVPCVAISYDLKTDGIMRDLGLDQYVVDINSITTEDLSLKVNKAIENHDNMKATINEHLETILNKARLNNELLNKLIKK